MITKTYPVFVSYWPEGSPHGHGLLVTDGSETMAEIFAQGIEGYAEELAEQVAMCGDQSHGHGRHHPKQEVERAYKMSVFQLLTKDFAAEWEEIQHDIKLYQKWGGQPPAMVFLPSADDPQQWHLMVPDQEGDPVLYELRKGIIDDILDPRQDPTAKPNQIGPGWTIGRN